MINRSNTGMYKLSRRFGGGKTDWNHPADGYNLKEWRRWFIYEQFVGPRILGFIGTAWIINRFYNARDEFVCLTIVYFVDRGMVSKMHFFCLMYLVSLVFLCIW